MEDGTSGKVKALDGDWFSPESLRKGASFSITIILNDQSEGRADILEVWVGGGSEKSTAG